jgi:hypothetical protein
MRKGMGMTHTTKQQLLFEIEHLPNAYIVELQNFIQYLKFKQARTDSVSGEKQKNAPDQDPILHAIGTIDVAPFSETIDDTLYTTL